MLPMLLTTYFQWSFQLQQDWLLEEEFPGLETESSDLSLSHLDCLAGSASSHCKYEIPFPANILIFLSHKGKETNNVQLSTMSNLSQGWDLCETWRDLTFQEPLNDVVDVDLSLCHGGVGWCRRGSSLM